LRAADIPARWGKPWTESELAYLRTAHARSELRRTTARALNRPLGGVRQKVKELGLQRAIGRPKRTLPRTRVQWLASQGFSLRSIGKLLGCDHKTVAMQLEAQA
jgi:hypothetical protein